MIQTEKKEEEMKELSELREHLLKKTESV